MCAPCISPIDIIFTSFQLDALAIELLAHGNTLIEKKNYEFAYRFYSFGINNIHIKSVAVKRDLLSNRSYLNELIGNHDAAMDDPEKCVKIAPDWREVGTCCQFVLQ